MRKAAALLLLGSLTAAHAQIRFDRYSIRDGLSQSSVNVIFQDSRGFMWFGTQDGLNRFDGYSFTAYKHLTADTSSISNNFIHCIAEDDAGFLWLGTDNGLERFDPRLQTFRHFLKKGSVSDNAVRAIALGQNGTLWLGTAAGDLCALNPQTGRLTIHRAGPSNKETLSSNHIRTLLEDRSGQLWVGTEGGGLNRFNPTTGTFTSWQHSAQEYSLAGNTVWSLMEDKDGQLWVGSNNGLSYMADAAQGRFINFRHKQGMSFSLPGNVVKALCQDGRGNIWVGTEGGGLARVVVDEKNIALSTFEMHRHQPELPASLCSDFVQCLFQDRFGSFWIGTAEGVSKFDPFKQGFRHYRNLPYDLNSLNDNTVWSIYEDSKGFLWVGTRQGLNRIDRQRNEFRSWSNLSASPNFINNRSVLSILESSDGHLWVGTVDELLKVSLSADHLATGYAPVNYHRNEALTGMENRVYVIFEDWDQLLWIGTRNGLCRMNPADGSFLFVQNDPQDSASLSGNTVRSILQDEKGVMWFGTDNGLNKLVSQEDGHLMFEHYQRQDGVSGTLSNNMVLSICSGRNGILWLGTYGGGLNQFDMKTKTFKVFTEAEGLSNNVIYSIQSSKDGRLWMSTNNGLSMFNPANNTFRNFDEEEGLQSNEFNIGAAHRNGKGELFFGGINGFNVFHPDNIKENPYPPLMVITGLRLFNKPARVGEESALAEDIGFAQKIELSYKEDYIIIEFAALHFTLPKKNQYMFKLVGLDEDFIHMGNTHQASYTNLAPGEYTLIVKGANSDGVWSEQAASLEIVILPPVWQTWWFRSLAVIAALCFIYLFYRIRVKRIKEQKVILEELVKERTTEVLKQKESIERHTEELQAEKEKVEQLLHNILPQETVEELKVKGKASARHYRMASVMFADVKNFTKISEKMRPQELVTTLDSYFVKYDEIIEKYGIEKIKTMGDAYMCVGGVPIRNRSNPVDMVLAGLEIQHYMEQVNQSRRERGDVHWDIRIGIHTGEIIAGVIGIKRFAYDIWGDTVNIANRMETSSEVGRVNISGKTYMHIKDYFHCAYRGKVEAKNKGEVDMYFVEGIKEELSVDGKGMEPNDMFWEYLNLSLYSSIHYQKAEKRIMKILKEGLSTKLTYHTVAHTRDVCEAAERIGKAEGVTGEDLFLLKTAALYHDAGFTEKYKDNEEIAVKLARETLPDFGYSSEQIDIIGGLIMATRLPQQPKNHLEEIMCDADLDYLGRDDFHAIADTLRDEFIAHGLARDHRHWDEIQIQFLEGHHYFTATSRKLRAEKKEQRLKEIRKRHQQKNTT